MAAEKALPAEVRRHLRQRIESARWVVDAVRQREETLLRVGHAVFAHQSAFLVDGPTALTPLSMGQVGEDLELHPSTVSRAVAGKHVQTDFGILPLRFFFQHTACDRTETSGAELLEEVKGLIAAEDKLAPLSDDSIAELLAQRGHTTKRRTVAKYRQQLGIPSSYLRRRYVDDPDARG
jgi:RNA polymerase sigma-54 factor